MANQGRVRITGLGVYVPETRLTNEQLEQGMPWLETSSQWIREHTGIWERHVAAADEHACDLGYKAAVEALELSRMEPEDIDLILLATNTSSYVYPAGAARIQNAFGKDDQGRLRMRKAGALDVQQGCASWIGVLGMAHAMIKGGQFQNVLCIGADVATRMVDWTNRDSILLGDAGCACVVSGDESRDEFGMPAFEILGHFMRTDPVQAEAIRQPGVLRTSNTPMDHLGKSLDPEAGHLRQQLYGTGFFPDLEEDEPPFFQMDGRQVYRFVKRVVPRQGYLEVLRSSGLLDDAPEELELSGLDSLDDLKDREERAKVVSYLATKFDLFVPHSANLSLNQELADEMGIRFDQMYVTLQKYANTSAASVGLSLYEALRQPSEYATLTKRDGRGEIKVQSRDIVAPMIAKDQVALLLSFGAGNSWNYLATRRL
jgi:3-oxoacyl-[acyl-carrier-protein] synthase III